MRLEASPNLTSGREEVVREQGGVRQGTGMLLTCGEGFLIQGSGYSTKNNLLRTTLPAAAGTGCVVKSPRTGQ